MEVGTCIRERSSVRDFLQKTVKEEDLGYILESAVQAPSAGNSQDWDFIVVRSEDGKRALADATEYSQDFIAKVPVVIVVCSNLKRSKYGKRGQDLYSIQDTAIAAQNMMLAAWDRGLGTCWIGAFREGDVIKSLGLPKEVRPVAMFPLGYPAGRPRKPARRSMKEVVHQERF
jgi:nitroreductase